MSFLPFLLDVLQSASLVILVCVTQRLGDRITILDNQLKIERVERRRADGES